MQGNCLDLTTKLSGSNKFTARSGNLAASLLWNPGTPKQGFTGNRSRGYSEPLWWLHSLSSLLLIMTKGSIKQSCRRARLSCLDSLLVWHGVPDWTGRAGAQPLPDKGAAVAPAASARVLVGAAGASSSRGRQATASACSAGQDRGTKVRAHGPRAQALAPSGVVPQLHLSASDALQPGRDTPAAPPTVW